MLKGDYQFETNPKKFNSYNTSNLIFKDDNILRPISASIKRPDFFKFNKTSNNINRNEYPNVYNPSNNSNYNNQQLENQKAKSISKNVEKERLYDDNINLKTLINNLRKDSYNLKSQVSGLEKEMNRKDKAIEDINYDLQSSHLSGGPDGQIFNKAKETSLIMNLKKQIKEVSKEIKQKSIELDQLKKNIKITKINELDIDITTLKEELMKVKTFHEISVKNNVEKERYLNDFILLKDVFVKQQNHLLSMNDKSKKLDQELKGREDEMNQVKNMIKDKDSKIIKSTKEFKEQILNNEKIDKESTQLEASAYQNKISIYEKKIEELRKDIYFFKNEAEKKDKKYKELDNILKAKPGFNANAGNNSFKESIKFSQNQQNTNDNVSTDFMKNKFQQIAKEKENLDIQNKKLTEKINFYENKQDISNHMNSNQMDVNNNEIKTNELVNNNGSNEDYKENKENSENDNIDEEELKNYLFNEDQFKEFTYILIKNFEAQKLDLTKLTKIFHEIDQNNDEIILSELANKIADSLGVKNQIDQTKILIYINTLLVYSGSDYDNFKQKFLTLFDSISSFTPSQQEENKSMLIKKLKKHIERLNESLKSIDKNNTGFITFQQLRKILDSIQINLSDELVEYLIYLMKCFTNDSNTSLEDLRYSNIVNLIPSSTQTEEKKSNSDRKHHEKAIINIINNEDENLNDNENAINDNKGSSAIINIDNLNDDNNEINIKNEDSEVVITSNQFNKILEGIFMKIAENLLINKKTSRSHFNHIIYSHELNNEVYEAIPLQYLLDDLEKINIKLDTIGIHCLYEKLKYSDDYESVDVGKLVEELENFGIFELGTLPNKDVPPGQLKEDSDEFYLNLGNFLKEKNMKLVDFLKDKIGIAEDGEMLISVDDLEIILSENNIMKNKILLKNILKHLIKTAEDGDYYSVSNLKTMLETCFKKNKKNPKTKEKNDTEPKKENNEKSIQEPIKSLEKEKEHKVVGVKEEVSLSNDIPEAGSKLFNETLNGEKIKEEDQNNQEDNSLLQLEKELEEEEKKRDQESKEKHEYNKD